MKKIKFAVIGTGGMGMNHCEYLNEIPEAELVGICDVNPEIAKKTAEKFKLKKFYTNYQQLINNEDINAVIIATPHYYHPPIAIYAMERKIHVLTEKPLAVSVSEADKMIEAAKKNKVSFSVMFQRRTMPDCKLAKKIIDEGKIGKICRVFLRMAAYRTQAYYDSAAWRGTWKGEGGGILINQAPHEIDILCWLVGLPEELTAKVFRRIHKIEVEDEAHALLKYRNGAIGYLFLSTAEIGGDLYEIIGEEGKLIIGNGGIRFFRFEENIQKFTFTTNETWGVPKFHEEKLEIPQQEYGHKVIIENFIKNILHGETLISPGEEGIYSLEVLNAILLSGIKGKAVKIPIDRSEFDELLTGLINGKYKIPIP